MSESNFDGNPPPSTPDHVGARNKTISVLGTIRENLSVGPNTEAIGSVLSNLGGVLAHADFAPNQSHDDSGAFYLRNPDRSLEVVHAYSDSEEGDYLSWFHLKEIDESVWYGHQMRLSDEFRDEGSYGVIIEEVITDPPLSTNDDHGELTGFQVNDTLKIWSFEENGAIEFEDVKTGLQSAVGINEVPLNVFVPKPMDTTAQ